MVSNYRSMGAVLLLATAAYGGAASASGTVVTPLSKGTFSSTNSQSNRMSCTGSSTRTCTHIWDASVCFEAISSTNVGGAGCDATGGGQTRGTATTGNLCTTTNLNTSLAASVVVNSLFYGSWEVPVDVAQTNGIGVFRGELTTSTRRVEVEGTFVTQGVDGGPCTVATRGDFSGTFTISTPI